MCLIWWAEIAYSHSLHPIVSSESQNLWLALLIAQFLRLTLKKTHTVLNLSWKIMFLVISNYRLTDYPSPNNKETA